MNLDWHGRDILAGRCVLRTIDVHVAGEPLRIVYEGFPPLEGNTILARRRYLRDHCDHLRRAMMHEPRGHFDMYGCVLTPPVSSRADLGVLFMHNEGYSTMCGHAMVGLNKRCFRRASRCKRDERTVN
ncbi:MAG: hypothetical protein KatS3mg105_2062 [Gemmatales bacterium]|nr:MAG: hypothetical protein KatS3mg105_2062 [Gemmatales bacterium]